MSGDSSQIYFMVLGCRLVQFHGIGIGIAIGIEIGIAIGFVPEFHHSSC